MIEISSSGWYLWYMKKGNGIYDLVIIGAGPAGLTASIHASWFHLKREHLKRELVD